MRTQPCSERPQSRARDYGTARPLTQSRTMWVGVVGLFVIGFVTPAAPWNEPDGYHGMAWGTSVDDAKATLNTTGLACLGSDYCVEATTDGSVPVYLGLTFRYGGLVMATLVFPSRHYESLRDLFLERYGAPTSTIDEQQPYRRGELVRNEILVWSGRQASVILRRYGSEFDEGRATIGLRSDVEIGPPEGVVKRNTTVP